MKINIVNTHWHRPTPNDFYIGRGSALGNPFSHLGSRFAGVTKVSSREEACECFAKYFEAKLNNPNKNPVSQQFYEIMNHLTQYGEVNLVCYCAPKQCHGETIKRELERKLMNIVPDSDWLL